MHCTRPDQDRQLIYNRCRAHGRRAPHGATDLSTRRAHGYDLHVSLYLTPVLEYFITPHVHTEAGQDDWFLDNEPGSLPLHPYRLRSTLFDHPKGCPPFTTYQVHIYRQWVDEFSVLSPPSRVSEEPFANMTHAWGGCVPHLQILHKGGST